MEIPTEFKDPSGLTCDEAHLIFMRALTPPLGDDGSERIIYAQVKEITEDKMSLVNLVTAVTFELPLVIFRFIPRVNERLTIDRVHRRLMAQIHHSRDDMVRLEIML